VKLTDIFKTQGKPSVTYVSPSSGHYESMLRTAIENRGTLCLVTGPSKTGKTTLVSKVAEQCELELIQIRCDDKLTPEEFWRRALEAVNFDRLAQRKNGNKHGAGLGAKLIGSIGWKWLAGLSGEFSTSVSSEQTEEQMRERILAKPSPHHLIPILKQLAALLVVEDFHYLTDDVKTTIFQQWKVFTDEEVSVVILGTTHHACDLAYANKDLIGRISKIELTSWLASDLMEILRKGCDALNVALPDAIIRLIADESVGLPIVTQAVALELFRTKDIQESQRAPLNIAVTKAPVYEVFHEVAKSKYGSFELAYERIIAGLRKRRRYKTYECMLGAFSLDPVVYRLKRHELIDRVSQLPFPSSELPPEGSIRTSLKLVNQLQDVAGVELIEWVKRDDCLYIVEPTFLFYLRWRKRRSETPDVLSAIKDFFINVEVDEKTGKIRTIRVVRPRIREARRQVQETQPPLH
jgi:hypothetical protein